MGPAALLRTGAGVVAAAANGHAAALRALVAEFGADPNAPDADARTACWAAAQHGHVEAIRALAELRADVGAPDNFGWTPCHAAAQHGEPGQGGEGNWLRSR